MLEPRIIPCLLFQDEGLVKTTQFKKPRYVGDAINAIRIFNAKEVDEMIFLDIEATLKKRSINLAFIKQLATECFMPLAIGGGVKSLGEIKNILGTGVEKVIINSAFFDNPLFIRQAADKFGSQSIVVSIDVKQEKPGFYRVFTRSGTKNTNLDVIEAVKLAEEMGAGEIMINSIDKDGVMSGYDTKLIKTVANIVNIPIIACGGAGSFVDLKKAICAGAQAAAAGSLFVFYGARRAVLINFPSKKELKKVKIQ